MGLYIGAIYGGPEFTGSRIKRLIWALRDTKDLVQPEIVDQSDGALDLVYHVAGSMLEVEFEGVRTSRLSTKERMMQVQMAVPRSALNAPNLLEILVDLLRQAVKVGGERLNKKKISFDEQAHLRLVDRMETVVAQEMI